MSAPAKNVNGRKHGLRSERALTLSDPPEGCGYIRRERDRLRRTLEAALLRSLGQITLTEERFINEASGKDERKKATALLFAKRQQAKKRRLHPAAERPQLAFNNPASATGTEESRVEVTTH